MENILCTSVREPFDLVMLLINRMGKHPDFELAKLMIDSSFY